MAEIKWIDKQGQALTCHEKLKVLSENLSELQLMAQDVFEAALILSVDETQIRKVMAKMISDMENPYV